MKNGILYRYSLLSRFEKILLANVFFVSLILISLLILFVWTGDYFVQSMYEQRSLPILNQLIQNQAQHPLEYYLALKKDVALHLFICWSVFSIFMVSGLWSLYRFFFSDKKVCPVVIVFVCSLATAILFLYNYELRITSIHTFFRAGPAYQILNGHIPPLDPLFGGEVLHYQWGYTWAAAVLSKILNITPFSSFSILNVLPLAGCLWLLYKISNLLIDDPKINIFSSFFTIYCGTFINSDTLFKLRDVIPFYGGENRIFPLIIKFNNNSGVPLGLVFFLLMVYGTMKLFEKKKPVLYSLLVLTGAIGSLFFYAAYGPGILAWFGFMGLLWLVKYKDDDFRAFGRTLLLLYALMCVSLLVVSPYLRQISTSGSFLQVDLFNPRIVLQHILNFLLPSLLSFASIVIFRKYWIHSLERRNLSIMVCLFASNLLCYLVFHIPSSVEYKFLLLAMIPFGIIGGIAFTRIQLYSKWLAAGLLFILFIPSLQLFRYQFESSPQRIFDINYITPYYENGTTLESRDPEENAMYRWIRENTSLETYFLDKETRIPVYAQRSLWIGFDTGQRIPGYAMNMLRLKMMHGYDEQEYCRRQQLVQNIFGTENSMTQEEVADYLKRYGIFVVVRDNNSKIPLDHYGLNEVFNSDTGRFSIFATVSAKDLRSPEY
jgi:hypothetical protein